MIDELPGAPARRWERPIRRDMTAAAL